MNRLALCSLAALLGFAVTGCDVQKAVWDYLFVSDSSDGFEPHLRVFHRELPDETVKGVELQLHGAGLGYVELPAPSKVLINQQEAAFQEWRYVPSVEPQFGQNYKATIRLNETTSYEFTVQMPLAFGDIKFPKQVTVGQPITVAWQTPHKDSETYVVLSVQAPNQDGGEVFDETLFDTTFQDDSTSLTIPANKWSLPEGAAPEVMICLERNKTGQVDKKFPEGKAEASCTFCRKIVWKSEDDR